MSALELMRGVLTLRILSRMEPEPTSGCWLWVGAIGGRGNYAHLRVGSKVRAAHRISYMLFRGPIPAGTELDHICRVTTCINPAHLEPVTHRENMLRGRSNVAARNATRTTCPRGHPYDRESTNKHGLAPFRYCYRCKREANQRNARTATARNEPDSTKSPTTPLAGGIGNSG